MPIDLQSLWNGVLDGCVVQHEFFGLTFDTAEILLAVAVQDPTLLERNIVSLLDAVRTMVRPRPWVWLMKASCLRNVPDANFLRVANMLHAILSTRGMRVFLEFHVVDIGNAALAGWMVEHQLVYADRVLQTSTFPSVILSLLDPYRMFSLEEALKIMRRVLSNFQVSREEKLAFASHLHRHTSSSLEECEECLMFIWLGEMDRETLAFFEVLVGIEIRALVLAPSAIHAFIRHEHFVQLNLLVEQFSVDFSDPEYWRSISSQEMLRFFVNDLEIDVWWPSWMAVPEALRRSIHQNEFAVRPREYEGLLQFVRSGARPRREAGERARWNIRSILLASNDIVEADVSAVLGEDATRLNRYFQWRSVHPNLRAFLATLTRRVRAPASVLTAAMPMTTDEQISRILSLALENPTWSMLGFLLSFRRSEDAESLHANALVVRRDGRRVERFEPHGHCASNDIVESRIRRIMLPMLSASDQGRSYNIRPLKQTCPFLGAQALEAAVEWDRLDLREMPGFCAIWSLMALHYCMVYPSWSMSEVSSHLARGKAVEVAARVRQYTAYAWALLNQDAWQEDVFPIAKADGVVENQRYIGTFAP
eukprot:ANDGO_07203.mRNA.1 hypothetical protein